MKIAEITRLENAAPRSPTSFENDALAAGCNAARIPTSSTQITATGRLIRVPFPAQRRVPAPESLSSPPLMLATELELPSLDYTDTALRGDLYRDAMAKLDPHQGWLASGPFGYIVTEREAGEFFLRTKQAIFPGLMIAEIFQISDGPLYEEIVNNIITVNGDDHRRLRNLVNPALSPRAVQRYRPAMQRFLAELFDEVPADGRCEFIESFAKPYPSLVIAEVMGAPLSDAPRLHYWSNMIQRQFDPTSLMVERAEIERAVA